MIDDKILKFFDEFYEAIKSGKKICTTRTREKCKVGVKQRLNLKCKGQVFYETVAYYYPCFFIDLLFPKTRYHMDGAFSQDTLDKISKDEGFASHDDFTIWLKKNYWQQPFERMVVVYWR